MSEPISFLVGIDEVGRGPLAGPVTVCACRVSAGFDLTKFRGIKDSKQLTPMKREKWFGKLSDLKARGELDFALSSVSAKAIDSNGLSWAIKQAMRAALASLALDPEVTYVRLDGALKAPPEFIHQETIIRGDEKIPLISAASIVAKVMRDRYMTEQAELFPAYGFERHKGYGTREHFRLIRKFGITPIHRKSFCGSIDSIAARG